MPIISAQVSRALSPIPPQRRHEEEPEQRVRQKQPPDPWPETFPLGGMNCGESVTTNNPQAHNNASDKGTDKLWASSFNAVSLVRSRVP